MTDAEKVVTSVCGCHCGGSACIVKVHVKDGVITRIETDNGEEPQLRAWMKGHPERRAFSDSERAELEKRMEKCRGRRSGKPARKHPSAGGVRPRF